MLELNEILPPNTLSGTVWTVAIALLWWRMKRNEMDIAKMEDRIDAHIDSHSRGDGNGRWRP